MPSPPALSFSPALALPGKGSGTPGGSSMAGGRDRALSPAQEATLCMGAIGSPVSTHKFCTAPHGTCAVVKHQTTKFNLEPTPASLSGTYLFIETKKPGVLSATVCLPVEAATDEGPSLEQWLTQRHTFDQSEAAFRNVLTSLKDPTGDKALSPAGLTAGTPNEQSLTSSRHNQGFRTHESHRVKAAFTALAEQPKEFRTHLIQSEMKVEELVDLSSIDLQLAVVKLIIRQQNGNYMDTLMEGNAKFIEDLGKLKAQPLALAKAKQDKVMQLFNYSSPELTQTPGVILLDRISRLKLATAKPSLHVPGLSGFNSLLFTPPAKLADMADLQARLNTLEVQFTPFREESDNTKVHAVSTYFTSQMDSTSLAFNSKGGTGSTVSFESSVTKSFRYAVLEVFTGGKISADPMILSAIPLWSSFEGEGSMDGFRYKLQAGLDDVVEKIRQETMCIQDTKTFTSGLSQWMCLTYQHLQKSNPSSSKENWQYISHCKVGAKLGVEKSVIMWGYLQGRQTALEFTQDGSSNHPVVQTVLNEHMRHRAVMRDEMSTHLAALKKEQEEVMKELWSLKILPPGLNGEQKKASRQNITRYIKETMLRKTKFPPEPVFVKSMIDRNVKLGNNNEIPKTMIVHDQKWSGIFCQTITTCRHNNARTLARKNYKDDKKNNQIPDHFPAAVLITDNINRKKLTGSKPGNKEEWSTKGEILYRYVLREDKESKKEQRQKEQCNMIETICKDREDYKYYTKYMKSLQKLSTDDREQKKEPIGQETDGLRIANKMEAQRSKTGIRNHQCLQHKGTPTPVAVGSIRWSNSNNRDT
eukprot:jgi/Psemu1/9719/gm1.9719_g